MSTESTTPDLPSRRELVERLIDAIEDAAEQSTALPVTLTFQNGGIVGQDMFVGVPANYWNSMIFALNELVTFDEQARDEYEH